MKVTIDVPAPSQLLELVSRLRQKNRNYKLQLKQLGRAHFITKRLLQSADARMDAAAIQYRAAIEQLEQQLRNTQASAEQAAMENVRLRQDLRVIHRQQEQQLPPRLPPMPQTFRPNVVELSPSIEDVEQVANVPNH